MKTLATILIISHASLGGISLLSGLVSMITTKGTMVHKKAGIVFSISLLISSTLAIPVTFMPNHKNTFLFLIAYFTIYLIVTGNRALHFKTHLNASVIDYGISSMMVVFALFLVYSGIKNYGASMNILNFFFGGLALILTARDFRLYNNPKRKPLLWLNAHIGKMIGAYTAAVTAFLVAGMHLSNTIYWIIPAIIGNLVILYWYRKINR